MTRMELNSPSCTAICNGSCCVFQRSVAVIGGQSVQLFQATYLGFSCLNLIFWLTRLSRANTTLIPVYFKFLLLTMGSFVFVLLLHLLPQTGTTEYESALQLLYAIGLILQWFVQVAMVAVMLEKSSTTTAIKWALGRASSFSFFCGLVWMIGLFVNRRSMTSVAVEGFIATFFTIMCILYFRPSKRKLRPMVGPWCAFMSLSHCLFLVSYVFVVTIPDSNACSCLDIISFYFYFAFYGVFLYFCLTGDSRFWKLQGGALLAAADGCEHAKLLGSNSMGDDEEHSYSQEGVGLDASISRLSASVHRINRNELRLERTVGQGQFGVVHCGRYHNTLVAVKEFKVCTSDWSEAVTALLQETSILSQLRHPGIVSVVGVCIEPPSIQGNPACMLITDFVAGGSLFEAIMSFRQQGEPSALMDWTVRLRLMTQLAEAVSFMHSRTPPLLHRDIKSPNILLSSSDANMNARLCDFGVSRVKKTTSTMTSVGTPQWMAPEVLRGERYGDRADIWAVGVVFWELACLNRPFEGIPPMRVISLVAYEDVQLPPPPTTTPKNVARVIRDCLKKKADERISAKEVVHKLSKGPST